MKSQSRSTGFFVSRFLSVSPIGETDKLFLHFDDPVFVVQKIVVRESGDVYFLHFFDFLSNTVQLPNAAITICLLVSRVIGVEKIEEEVTLEGKPFRRKRIFNFMIKYLCPIFAAIILISSVANALGVISM